MSADFDNKGAQADTLNQAGENIYIGSTHVVGNGPVTINNIRLERHWTRPVPPGLMRDTILREQALKEVSRLLMERGQLALSGRIAATAVRGMPGIGKTTLAQQLAWEFERERNPHYPDGILWEHIGPDVLSADKAQIVLDRWAGHALAIPPDARTRVHFEPGAVRALLSKHPRLLVVLDNVWSLEAIRPLREALPAQAHLLITTRSRSVAHALGGARYELHELTPEEARELMAMRLSLKDITPHIGWCDALAVGLGFHALALDIALSRLVYEGDCSSQWRASAERIVEYVRAGKGFEDLHVEEGESERNVELVLSYSYQHMAEVAQRRFRLLGTFAPDADFDTGAVAQLWECEPDKAKRHLDEFVNAALLGRMKEGRWQQHSLLRGYALALLRRAREYEAAAARHARIYGAAMKKADDAQRFASMRPELRQLRHAFEWAVQNDLGQALSLISNCANLQAAFGLAHESLEWNRAALTAVQQRGNPEIVAHVHGSLGNALQRVSSLPGQNRRACLREGLEAYGEALRFRTPEASPLDYATTQNNRAILLVELASLPGENRGARLREGLEAYGEALRFRTPEASPLAYAMTQSNRATLLQELASLPGEDREARLREALRAAWTAFQLFRNLQHQQYQEHAASQLQKLRVLCGASFDPLCEGLDAGPLPKWLTAEEMARAMIHRCIDTIAAASNSQALADFWQQIPVELQAPVLATIEDLIAHSDKNGEADLADSFRERLAVLQSLKAG